MNFSSMNDHQMADYFRKEAWALNEKVADLERENKSLADDVRRLVKENEKLQSTAEDFESENE